MTEKELPVVVHSLNKFRHYITGYQTFVHTDHDAIKYLMNKPDVNPRLLDGYFYYSSLIKLLLISLARKMLLHIFCLD